MNIIPNPQDLVNGLDNLKELAWGKVCIDLDIDRQKITTFGTPEEVEEATRPFAEVIRFVDEVHKLYRFAMLTRSVPISEWRKRLYGS
ncbi:MAG TPA: hypothetical protein EYP17_12325 [Candidatus Latescibacteria bacterium]|nr:hypothetical protein [Candidatus Latescibacterota bacterium]